MDQLELLRYLVQTLERLALPYFVTGSHATIAYGEPRFTNDIDVVVELRPQNIEAFCRSFPAPDFYLNAPAVRQAVQQRGQFNIIHPASGLKVDVMIPQPSEFDRTRMSRAIRFRAGHDCEAMFASPEDVILKKLEYYKLGGSEKHCRDIVGVLKIRGDRVDYRYIESWAAKLGLEQVWQSVRESVKPHSGEA